MMVSSVFQVTGVSHTGRDYTGNVKVVFLSHLVGVVRERLYFVQENAVGLGPLFLFNEASY
jgi:hypothetical protein